MIEWATTLGKLHCSAVIIHCSKPIVELKKPVLIKDEVIENALGCMVQYIHGSFIALEMMEGRLLSCKFIVWIKEKSIEETE